MGDAGELRETVLVLDEPAQAVIAGAAGFLRQRGLRSTLQTDFSVAFAEPGREPGRSRAGAGPRRGCRTGTAIGQRGGDAPAGDGAGGGRPGAGQAGVVPGVGDGQRGGAGRRGAGAYVAAHQDRAAQAERAVREIERGAYDQSRWPQHAQALRATLERQGLDEAAIEERVARYKVRWEALGRKIARSSD